MKTQPQKRNTLGMTMIEITVVMIVLGILASLAFPSYMIAVEKAKTAEAMNTLSAIYRAQLRHKIEHGLYATGAINGCSVSSSEANCLDVNIPSSSNFYSPDLDCTANTQDCPSGFGPHYAPPCGSLHGFFASVTRTVGAPYSYTLYMLDNGEIECFSILQGGPDFCHGICAQLGFSGTY